MYVLIIPSHEQGNNMAVFGPFESREAAKLWLDSHRKELESRIAPGGWADWNSAEIWCPFDPAASLSGPMD
jgi:hypothetical protein